MNLPKRDINSPGDYSIQVADKHTANLSETLAWTKFFAESGKLKSVELFRGTVSIARMIHK